MRISGRLRVPRDVVATSGALVTLRLVDVSRADACALTLDEHTVLLTPAAGRQEPAQEFQTVVVDLSAPELDPRSSYALTAHVDLTGSGEVAPGDLITTMHVGVSTHDVDRVVDVPLQQI